MPTATSTWADLLTHTHPSVPHTSLCGRVVLGEKVGNNSLCSSTLRYCPSMLALVFLLLLFVLLCVYRKNPQKTPSW